MGTVHTISVDAETAALIEKRADETGLTVEQLVTSLVRAEAGASSDASLVELQRRWTAIEQGEETVPHDKVKRWLRTWGTADFKKWPDAE